MPANRPIDELCDSVADGTAVDWATVDSQAQDDDSRELVEQLRVVAELASAQRLMDEAVSADRTHSAAPVLEPILRRWGRYDLIQELGHGTFGRVYRAWDPDLERYVAIKLLHAIDGVTDALRDRVLREGRAIAKISHTNVVSVFGVEVHDGRVGLCMELVTGKTLDQIVRAQATLGAQEAMMIGQSVCRAMSAVHGANLVHRDIKARNVMRADGGRIVLMDFGAGQALRDRSSTRRGDVHGTPLYMAPEALAGHAGSVATDIYSTGVLLYYLVTGRYPFEGATTEEVERAHRKGERRFIADRRPDLPVPFVRLVEKALDPDPRRRPQTASELLLELMDAGDYVVAEPGASLFQHLSAFVARNATGAGLFALLALVACLVLGFFNSYTYYNALGLDASWMHETPLSWLRWGFKSIVAPLTLILAVSLVSLVVTEVIALVRRVSSTADEKFRTASAPINTFLLRTGFTRSTALAWLLVALSLVFDWWVVFWQYPDLLNATMTAVDDASVEVLSRLAPTNYDTHAAYRQVLSLGLLGMVFVLSRVVRTASRRGERVRPLLMGAAVAVVALTVVLLDVPYRLLWHNEGEKALYKGNACYVVAQKEDSLRVFCANGTPRSVVVPAGDPALVRSGTFENIFTPFSQSDTK
jgi:eukaryotic-like serine/threonine-protein kinase